ncbi:hypothetical protein NL533_34355, partial [Klebsiella pneumoniae]|nr:hypothetical protein [Klebsiella pneumoniae]
VVTLNIYASENRLYDELVREAHSYLGRLSAQLPARTATQTRVRIGRVTPDIVAEAKTEQPDLVILSRRPRPSQNARALTWVF